MAKAREILEPGRHQFVYNLSTLPLKPGCYFWRVSLYDDAGLVGVYDGIPPMLVSTDPLGHPSDDWAGMLKIPYELARSWRAPEGSGDQEVPSPVQVPLTGRSIAHAANVKPPDM